MSLKPETAALLRHLQSRPGHDEVKADFRQLLIEEFAVALDDLEFERRVPEVRGRLDALIGRTVFEAKKNLDREWDDVVRKMPDYLSDRERETGEKFVGIASDGLKWAIFERSGGGLAKVKETTLDAENGELFLAWLDGALALKKSLPPDGMNVRMQLGKDSEAYRIANEKLAALWDKVKAEPAVALKRQLWAQLLKLVYGKDVENDRLFFQHTFLVIVAKAIALAVLDLNEDDPKRVLSGAAFEAAGVMGAAESDFFDWVVADGDGEALVRRILVHVRRFRLDQVESDVLKILYESLIDRDERHGLGEYYTPDWLAAKIVRHAVERPIEQRVLDPACGSGTFLFHAVRNALTAANEVGIPQERRASEVTALVQGLDIHPVAVIIARVTYLLALQPVLTNRRGTISIPVYLGDAMQLSVTAVLDAQELRVRVPPAPGGNGETTLDFPEVFCRDSMLFDKAIEVIRNASEAGWTRRQVEAQLGQTMHEHFIRTAGLQHPRQIGPLEEKGIAELGATYLTYDRLRREGRNSIWSYVARNLSRPLAYTHAGSPWANVVVGNPPWVAYRHMSADLQKRFRDISRGENVHVGGKFGTQSDLSALFAVRCAGFYLRAGGRIAFVMPFAALTRGQFEKLRDGSFFSAKIAWEEVWTMDDSVQPLFPVPSCVVFGRRQARAKPMPDTVRAYSGTLPIRDAHEDVADRHLHVQENAPRPKEGVFTGGSAYRKAFRQGAIFAPRMLVLVGRRASGRLGTDAGAPFVASRRSTLEKAPWKSASGIEHRVEVEFLRPILLGESILPFRVYRTFEGVVPATDSGEILDANAAANRGHSGLNGWMSAAERTWNEHRPSPITFVEQLDYYGKLSSQLPGASLRIVYATSGTIPAACVLRDPRALLESSCYWSACSETEAWYLASVLNSETTRSRSAEYQARGQWGARHFHKVMFNLPIPRFDEKQELHRALAEAAAEAEAVAAAVVLPENVKFQRARKLIRDALGQAGLARRIDSLVAQLLDGTGSLHPRE